MNQDKNVGFIFFQVRCTHKSGDVINFIILACRNSSRLKWYKNYKNRLRLAKVIVKNKMSRFLWFTVYISLTLSNASLSGWIVWTADLAIQQRKLLYYTAVWLCNPLMTSADSHSARTCKWRQKRHRRWRQNDDVIIVTL